MPCATLRSTLASALSLFLLTAVALIPASAQKSAPSSPQPEPAPAQLVQKYGELPLSFEKNQGQADPTVQFLSRGQGYSIFLTGSSATLELASHSSLNRNAAQRKAAQNHRDLIRMDLVNANAAANIAGEHLLPGKVSYFLGHDPAQWHANLPTFASVRSAAVYPGVDLVYYGNQRRLEYDFIVAPGSDPSRIRLHFAGARKLSLTPQGDLKIDAKNGAIGFQKPVIYQIQDGQRQPVAGQFALLPDHAVAFTVKRYDHTLPLVIDPVLSYSTWLGGSEGYGDFGYGIAVDASGDAYVTGQTTSIDFPTSKNAIQTTNNNGPNGAGNAFVTKLNATGSALLYSTYLGGSGQSTLTTSDGGFGIAVDSSGDAYVTGLTSSRDFPVTDGAFQTTYNGTYAGSNAFVAKLNPAGTELLYSTFLGGSNDGNQYSSDQGYGIAVDSSGDAYIAGPTSSSDFPITPGAYQTSNNASANNESNAFVTKLNPTGSAEVYSTYLGGSGIASNGPGDTAFAIAIDSSGDAYVTGQAISPNFPVSSAAYQKTNKQAANQSTNAFVAKLNPAGSALVYSTYLGGTGVASTVGIDAGFGDVGYGIAVDSAGDAFIAGQTGSTNFPTTSGAFQTANAGAANQSPNAFVTEVNPTGTALLYSTYLGGSGLPSQYSGYAGSGDGASGLALDSSGDVYVTGTAFSTNFPLTTGAYQTTNNGAGYQDSNIFVSKLNPAGSALVYSTYLGGSFGATGKAIAQKGAGVFITGFAFGTDYPVTPGAVQQTNNSAANGYAGVVISSLPVGSAGTTTTPTTTALAASANPQTTGASVTFTADVTPSSGSTVPTGNVAFSVDGKTAATVTLASGKATYATSTLAAGTHSILASYAGSATFAASASSTLTETITAPTASAPTFSPAVGTYTTPQSITITDSTSGATIYYTTDGSTPTTASTKYTAAITVSKTETIKAIAVATGYSNSAVATATYTITAAAPTVSLTPASLTFASTAIGSTSAAQTVTLKNTGTSSVTLTGITFTGTNPTAFTKTTTCGASLAASATCTISVSFAPTSAGTLTASLAVADNATGSPQTVALTGTGTSSTAATVTASPTTLTFPTTITNATSPVQVVTLTNTGTTAVTAKSYTITGTNASSFLLSNKTCGTTIAAGASCTISIAFRPTAAGTLTASLLATDNAAGSPQSVALTGTGQLPPTVTVTPNKLTYPATTLGSAAAPQVVTVKNIGTATVTVQSYKFTGTNASDYTLSAKTCTTSLAAGASCTLTVTFKPTAAGTLTASLVASDSSPGSPQTIALTGTGVTQPTVSLSPSTLTFPATKVGAKSATQTVTLTNTGQTALTVHSFTFTGTNASSFLIASKTCGTSLAAGANCTLSVEFKPATTGSLTAKLSVSDNAVGTPQTTSLSGTGQ